MINNFYLLIRKFKSILLRLINFSRTLFFYISIFGNPLVSIGKKCQFGKSIKFLVTDGGVVSIGQHTCFGDNVQIIVQGGNLLIENNVFVGAGSIIVCREDIFIGEDTLIAEYVVIRDQDHSIDLRPVRSSGFHTSPIHIGKDVWIGCKATVLRGASVGNRCVIGAHALVKSRIPDAMLAVGVPARVVKRFESSQ
jgi:acetyltransferase-like isoleucine patch superfamily enzyme